MTVVVTKLGNELVATSQADDILKVFTVKSKVNTFKCGIRYRMAFALRRLS